MFILRIQLPDKFKEPLEEVTNKYSKKNDQFLESEKLIETVVKRYLADEYKIILLESKEEHEV